MIHNQRHPQAGQTVTIQSGAFKGKQYRIEDWWDRVSGESWAKGNPACIEYAMRFELPSDDEVVYGKIGCLGHLIHISEFESAGNRNV